ncbi:MAG: hypothetical protein ACLGGY_04660 [Gammaproteobacteria bacterium]
MRRPIPRFAPVLHVFGMVILIFSFTMLVPLVTALVGHDTAQFAFDESFAVTLIAGCALWLGRGAGAANSRCATVSCW